jgi:hypothetical protein
MGRSRWRIQAALAAFPIFGILCYTCSMIVIGTDLVESYFADRSGHKGIKAAWSQYQA